MTSTAERLVPLFEERPPSTERVLVAVPAFNEERFIGSVVHGVRLEGFDCLVIDDGSSDRTVEIARAAGATIVRHEANEGKSAAVSRALRVARQMGVSMLVLMDGDWQHNPIEIHALLAPLRAGEADIVSGSRFLTSDTSLFPAVRGMGLRAMTAVSNVLSGDRVTDSQTGFHAFSRQAIERLRFRSNGFSVEVEVQFLARSRALRHIEVPISIRYDDPPKRNVLRQGAQVLDGLIRLAAHYRPLLFFGLPSALLLLGGIVIGVLVLDIYQGSREFAGGYALMASVMIIVGAIGLFTGLLLHVLRGVFVGLEHQLHTISHAVEGTDDQS